ncbi:hypothetical protein AXG53_07110 [Stenotrophomonas sp. KCTC 12332]|nr:hypothetical protein AXG53_07110 [Stenotrophomonas sp. KCTC 12332]
MKRKCSNGAYDASMKTSNWRGRAAALLTTVVILCIVSNPELATLVPVLDALGLEVLLALFSAQLMVIFSDVLLPYARHIHQRWGRRVLKPVGDALWCFAGNYLRELIRHMRLAGMPARIG